MDGETNLDTTKCDSNLYGIFIRQNCFIIQILPSAIQTVLIDKENIPILYLDTTKCDSNLFRVPWNRNKSYIQILPSAIQTDLLTGIFKQRKNLDTTKCDSNLINNLKQSLYYQCVIFVRIENDRVEKCRSPII